jgi:hypothetical protein
MRRLLACLALVFVASPTFACLNDAELPRSEREFRSQYKRQTTPPVPAAEPTYPGGTPLLFGGGSLLLIGAVGLTMTGRRAGK